MCWRYEDRKKFLKMERESMLVFKCVQGAMNVRRWLSGVVGYVPSEQKWHMASCTDGNRSEIGIGSSKGSF